MPVAGVAVVKGPSWVAFPFGLASVSYAFCAWWCGRVLLPRTFGTGIAGSGFLSEAAEYGANLTQMYAQAALFIDAVHVENEAPLLEAGDAIEQAISWLAIELSLLALSLAGTVIG
jgi:hypothetical protein